MSNDPQILLRNPNDLKFSLISDNVRCPLSKLLETGTPQPINAKLCDNGLMVVQTQSKTFKLLVPDDDADGDGMPDDWEVNYGFNPAVNDADSDADHDGTSNYGEFLLRSDPKHPPALGANGETIDTRPGIDTDADGIPNSWECANGLDYNDASDAAKDFDRDGYSNLQEYHLNTDPRGNPSFRVREIGPFPGTSTVALSSAVLGAGESQSGGTVTDTVTFLVRGASPNIYYDRPAKWSWNHSETTSPFSIYPALGNQASTKVAFAPNGAALTRYSSDPIMFPYWASSGAPGTQILFSGASSACNIKSLNSLSISPSGNYVAGMRMNYSSVWEPVIWKMSSGEVPLVLPKPSTSFTISSTAKIEVNDAGYAAVTATNGTTNCTLLWHVVGTSVSSPVVLPALISGGWTTLAGISNTSPPVVGGNAVLSTGKTHAVYWSQSGQIVDLGTLGGTASSLSLVSGDGHMAGTSEVLVDNTLKYQTFIVTPHRNAGSQTIISCTKLAQGDPVAYGSANIVLKSIGDSGEVLGTTRPNGNEANPIPTLWHHGRAYPLDTVLTPSSGYTLSSVDALNGCGTVLATAWKNGYSSRILLTPDCDTDGDGMSDSFENQNHFNPFAKSSSGTDSDSDELTDIEEYRNGTNPRNSDSDGDGMKDGWEVRWGLQPLDPSDSSLDPDNDQVSNLRESQINTNPTGIYRTVEVPLAANESVTKGGPDGMVITETQFGETNYVDNSYYNYEGIWYQKLDLPSQVRDGLGSESIYYAEGYDAEWDELWAWEEICHAWVNPGLGHSLQGRDSYEYYSGFYGLELGYGEYGIHSGLTDSAIYATWESIESTLRTTNHLAQADSIPFTPALISPQGERAFHVTSTGQNILLDRLGNYSGTLPKTAPTIGVTSTIPWQALNEAGQAAAVKTFSVATSNGIPGHTETKILFWDGSTTRLISTPSAWYPTVTQPAIGALSDDGQLVVRRPLVNPDGTTRDEFHLLNLWTSSFTRILQPGLGSESIASLSYKNRRLLGAGPKAFQVTPDGTSIRLEALQFRNSINAATAPLATTYPNALTPNYMDADGSLILSTTNAANQRVILQIIPQNDADNDGMPDDWEMANDLTDPNADSDYDGLSNLNEFQHCTDPTVANDSDGDGMDDGFEAAAGMDIHNADENNNGVLDGWEDFDSDGYLNLEEIAAGTDSRDGSKKPDGITTSILIVRDSLPAGTLLQAGITAGLPSKPSWNIPIFSGGAYYQNSGENLELISDPPVAAGYEVSASYRSATGYKDFAFKELRMDSNNVHEDTTYCPKFYLSDTVASHYESTDSGESDVYINALEKFLWNDSREENNSLTGRWKKSPVITTDLSSEWPGCAGYQVSNFDEFNISETKSGNPGYKYHKISGTNPDVLVEDHTGTPNGRPSIPTVPSWRTPIPVFTDKGGIIKDTGTEQAWEDVVHFSLPWSDVAIGDVLPIYGHPVNETNDTQAIGSTETMTRTLTEEYSDGQLGTDLDELMKKINNPFSLGQYGEDGTVLAYQHWSDGHVNLSKQDAKYKLTHRVMQTGLTKIVFLWAEDFYKDRDQPNNATKPEHEFKMLKETFASNLTINSYVQTKIHEVKVPDVPGRVAVPNASMLSTYPFIQVKGDSAATTPSDEQLVRLAFHTPRNYANNEINLTASGDGEVKVWRKNGGIYEKVELPYLLKREEKAGGLSKSFIYALQGVKGGEVHLSLKNGNDEITYFDVQVIALDIDIDSNNSGVIDSGFAEDKMECDPAKPGKIVVVNPRALSDPDGVPDSVDGLAEIEVAASGLTGSDQIEFKYNGSTPKNQPPITNSSGVISYANDPGSLRIWKKPQCGGPPATQSDYIQPDTPYTLSGLGISAGSSQEFYVQGVSPITSREDILLVATKGGIKFEDAVKLTVISVDVKDNDPDVYSGVDDVSITAIPNTPGAQDKFWIMAPINGNSASGPPNDTQIRFSTGYLFAMTIFPTHATVSPNPIPFYSASRGPMASWQGGGTVSADEVLAASFGSGIPAVDLPIGIKTMKHRTVKVVVHYVTGKETLTENGIVRVRLRPPSTQPTEEKIKEKLREVFSLQVNTWFENLTCKSDEVEWDIGEGANWGTTTEPIVTNLNAIETHNRVLDLGGNTDGLTIDQIRTQISNEEQKLLGLRSLNTGVNIDVFVIGGCWTIQSQTGTHGILVIGDQGNDGITKREHRAIYIAGEKSNVDNPLPPEELLYRIAHEIGHVIIGDGHPDTGTDQAPLDGTAKVQRLMFSDTKGKIRADALNKNLLVKKEWDEAEAWMGEEERQGRMTP